MKVLLVGISGLLGKHIFASTPSHHRVIGTYMTSKAHYPDSFKLDITKENMVNKVLNEIQPDIVMNAASLGNVDYCEKHQEEAWKVNVVGNENMLSSAKKIGAKYIFFSSNAVFNGNKPPYREKSTIDPVNFYGKTKAVAEEIILKKYPHNSLILRLTTMYGWNDTRERNNPATWIISRLSKNMPTHVVDDVFNNHLWVGQAANTIWKAIDLNFYGEIFHIAGNECISRYEFSKKVAQVFNLDEHLLLPVSSTFFPSITPRPHNTCFDTSKMKKILKIKPLDVSSGLTFMKKEKKI